MSLCKCQTSQVTIASFRKIIFRTVDLENEKLLHSDKVRITFSKGSTKAKMCLLFADSEHPQLLFFLAEILGV